MNQRAKLTTDEDEDEKREKITSLQVKQERQILYKEKYCYFERKICLNNKFILEMTCGSSSGAR